MWVPSLGQEDALEEGMATHSSIPAWRTPWTEEPVGSQRVGHNWSDWACTVCSDMGKTRGHHTKRSKSERERQIPSDITCMWNLKYDANEPSCGREIEPQTQRTGCQREGPGSARAGGWGGRRVVSDKTDKQQGLTGSTGSRLQYPTKRTSLVVQRLRTSLAVQGTRVWSLIGS